MNITWRERIYQEPSLSKIANWAILLPDELPASQRKGYVRNRRIVASVLAGEPVAQVAKNNDVSPGRVSQVMARTLGGDALDPPALAKGLLPFANVTKKIRHALLPTVTNQSGASCAFAQLLCQVTGLAENLDKMLEAKLRDKSNAQTLSPQRFHGEFKRHLAAMNWPKDRYPYNTEQCAYESVRQYFHARMDALQSAMKQKRERVFHAKNLPPACYAGRAIQIDEQTMDLHVSLSLDINGIPVPIPLPRISILVAIDVDTQCILNYTLALAKSPNQDHMLEVLQGCITPRKLPALRTQTLTYTPGAHFPCTLPDSPAFQFGTVQLDNALMHQSRSVIEWIGTKMGAAIHYGLPKHPTVRHLIEHTFHRINRYISHRAASTTGSHPKDPIKESSREYKKLPLVTFQLLDEMLAVTLTDWNVFPKTSLLGSTPLNAFTSSLRQQCCLTLPEALREDLSINLIKQNVTVKKRNDQVGAAYVNFCYTKYYGECLSSRLIDNQEIVIRYNRKDVRSLKAYLPSGEYLGELQVSKSWARYPHSFQLRKKIHQTVRKFKFHSEDKLAAYYHHLLNNLKNPDSKLKIATLHQSFTDGRFAPLSTTQFVPSLSAPPNTDAPSLTNQKNQKRTGKNQFSWSTKTASHSPSQQGNNEGESHNA